MLLDLIPIIGTLFCEFAMLKRVLHGCPTVSERGRPTPVGRVITPLTTLIVSGTFGIEMGM